MALIFFLATLIFAFLYFSKIQQVKKLKRHLHRSEKKLSSLKNQEEEFFSSLSQINSESPEQKNDSLTSLPSHQTFEDRLLQIIHQSKRNQVSFAIMIMNIDNFKRINEVFGYVMGDKLLREVAKRVQSAIRQVDTVTRFAGDNFMFLLPQLAKPQTAAYVAQRVQDSIIQPFVIDNNTFSVTASLGISTYPIDGQDPRTLLKSAEAALYQAKDSGTNAYRFYQQEMHALSQRELSVSAAVRSPDFIDKLVIHYQPSINVKTKSIEGIHALVFLNHSEFGLIPFSEFARVAENNDKIIEMGKWLLQQMEIQLKQWKDQQYFPRQLGLTVSLRQIANADYMQSAQTLLASMQNNSKQLIFDIYADPQSPNYTAFEKAFEALAPLNVQISVGIYALGHLALQRMTELPINFLKIESKLTHDLLLHQENEGIVNMIISLAKNLNIGVVAEGVEQEQQKQILLKLGCEVMQGRLFGTPVSADSIRQLSKTNLTSAPQI